MCVTLWATSSISLPLRSNPYTTMSSTTPSRRHANRLKGPTTSTTGAKVPFPLMSKWTSLLTVPTWPLIPYTTSFGKSQKCVPYKIITISVMFFCLTHVSLAARSPMNPIQRFLLPLPFAYSLLYSISNTESYNRHYKCHSDCRLQSRLFTLNGL